MKVFVNAGRRALGQTVFAVATVCGVTASAEGARPAVGAFGVPAAIEMPDAASLGDGDIALSFSRFAGEPRQSLTFQITPRLTGVFRYSRFGESNVGTPWDRSFSLHYRLLDESRWVPAMAIGMADITGTSLYSSEYLVFSKTLSPELRLTTGIGWGRLGSYGGFSNPLGLLSEKFETRPAPDIGKGGSFDPSVWFRGDAALFGALQWYPRDDLRFVLEYSSDAYARQDGRMFSRRSPINLGVDYQFNERLTASARYLYGSEIGLQFTYLFNPYKRHRLGAGVENAPLPLAPAGGQGITSFDDFKSGLAAEGITLIAAGREGDAAVLVIENARYRNDAQAVGRTARLLVRTLPEDISHYRLILTRRGLPLSEVHLARRDLLDEEFASGRNSAPPASIGVPPFGEPFLNDGQDPSFDIGLEPFIRPAFFDPENPLRAAGGLRLESELKLARGLYLNGAVERVLAGNLDESTRASTSVLPRVRSESNIYDREGELSLAELTLTKYFRPGPTVYARITTGYIERMFGGVSGEVLWKPVGRPYSVTAELNWVRQRDFDQDFGFRDYSVATGHLAMDYKFTDEFVGRLSVGRYLAGDFGATLELGRQFRNGWEISAFATLTDVSFEDFGEGSFDKGINMMIPLDWIDGKTSRRTTEVVLRPVLRDGGAQLNVPRRLHDVVNGATPSELSGRWSRFWR